MFTEQREMDLTVAVLVSLLSFPSRPASEGVASHYSKSHELNTLARKALRRFVGLVGPPDKRSDESVQSLIL